MKTLYSLLCAGLLSSFAFSGEPSVATIEDAPAVSRKFDLWEATQIYGLISYSFDTEEFGAGFRLAYDINDHVNIRADYSSTDFTESAFGADSSLSLAFLYPVTDIPGLTVYTITGVGVSNFDAPALELIAGVGVEYEIKSWRVFAEYQYNSEDEDSVARLGFGVKF
jgi:opacity protein-like surface antigen